MLNAIQTKYLPATSIQSTRIKASNADGHFRIVQFNHSLSVEMNHAYAARLLAEDLGQTGVWSGGVIEGGYCFVASSGVCCFELEPEETKEHISKGVL